MPKPQPLEFSGRFWLDREGHSYLGAGRIELLEHIGECGSISQAAKRIGMSYKAAWDAVEAMNNLADRPLVVRGQCRVEPGLVGAAWLGFAALA